MDEAALTERIEEMLEAVARSSPLETGKTSDEKGTYLSEVPSGPATLPERLDHLRLQIKYLRFDLEATHRENRYLRLMLEARSRRRKDTDGADGVGSP